MLFFYNCYAFVRLFLAMDSSLVIKVPISIFSFFSIFCLIFSLCASLYNFASSFIVFGDRNKDGTETVKLQIMHVRFS